MAQRRAKMIRLNEAEFAALNRIVVHHALSDATAAIRWLIIMEDRRIAELDRSRPPLPPKAIESDDVEGFD